jgi:ribosome biogenesis protein YTM1
MFCLSGSHDQTLIIWAWDFAQNSVERMHVCRGHAGSVDAIGVNPDKTRFLSGSWDKSLKLWSTSLVPEPGEVVVLFPF